MWLNQTVRLLHFTTTVISCNSIAMSPHLLYLTKHVTPGYLLLLNSALIQTATCQFLTDSRYGWCISMDSALFVHLICWYFITLSWLVDTWQAYIWLVCVWTICIIHHVKQPSTSHGNAIPMTRWTSDNCTQAGIFATYTSQGNTTSEAGSGAKYRCQHWFCLQQI